jgi:hypothetical protein
VYDIVRRCLIVRREIKNNFAKAFFVQQSSKKIAYAFFHLTIAKSKSPGPFSVQKSTNKKRIGFFQCSNKLKKLQKLFVICSWQKQYIEMVSAVSYFFTAAYLFFGYDNVSC